MTPAEELYRRILKLLYGLAGIVVVVGLLISGAVYIAEVRDAAARDELNSYRLHSLELSAEIDVEMTRLHSQLNVDGVIDPLVSHAVALSSAVNSISKRIDELNRLQQQFNDPRLDSTLKNINNKLQRIAASSSQTTLPDRIDDHIESFRLSIVQFERLHQMGADELIRTLASSQRSGADNVAIGAALFVLIMLGLLGLAHRALTSSLESHQDTEEALALSEKRYRDGEKLRAIGQLVGGVAHDFNNLLTIIVGYTESTLQNSHLPADARSALDEIQQAGMRAADLTRRLLSFASQATERKICFNLNELVTDSISMLKPLIGDQINLSVDLDREVLLIDADPTEMQQVITNLIINARDAVSNHGTIAIKTGRTAEAPGDLATGDGYCLLSVMDNGCGMDEATRARLFEPFFTTKGVGDGTGLGLSVVHGIVSGLSGAIEVLSQPGEGARFDIYLPLSSETATEHARESTQQPRGGEETLLVVEDEQQILAMLSKRLSGLGYRILNAQNGREAVEISRAHSTPIDLILTDVIMPEKNGPEAVAEILARRPDIAVIYMSGYTDDIVLEAGAAGGAILMRKPFNLDDLVRVIRACLDKAENAVA